MKWRSNHWFAKKFRNSLFPDKLLDYLLRTLPIFAYNKIDFFYEAVTYRIKSELGGGGAAHIMEWLKLRVLLLVK